MCSISGFFNPYADYSANQAEYQQILKQMTTVLFHRGPDECGFTLSKRCGLAHTRLSIIDLKTGSQPMVYETGGFSYQMIFNGEIYNLPDLKQQLASLGYTFRTTSDTEVLLLSFLEYGPDFVKQVDGIFSFAVYDERHETIYLFRDYFGANPPFHLPSLAFCLRPSIVWTRIFSRSISATADNTDIISFPASLELSIPSSTQIRLTP